MTERVLHLVVPGSLDQKTGGYLYDARMVAGLGALGWRVVVHGLAGDFPGAGPREEAGLAEVLRDLPDGARVLLDGLAMAAFRGASRSHAARLRVLGLVHHPLADETGLPAAERARFAALERDALAACSGIIVTSAFTAARLGGYGVRPERLRVVYPGVDPAPAATGPGPGEPPRLLCVGAVVPRKGQDVLVRALARIRDARWSCACVGSLTRAPGFASAVLAKVVDEDLAGRIRFPGECDRRDLDEHYDAASVFVFPSHYEGYGMALAEALVRGLPVVSTTGGAIPDVVPPGAGVLVPPGDERALADALGGLLSEPEGAARRAEMGAAARRHGLTLPCWTRAVEAFAQATLELTSDE